jgi:hypothetical protein
MDDGRSFDYRGGARVLRKFSFAGGTLSAVTAGGGDAPFPCRDAAVERIVVAGVGASAATGSAVTRAVVTEDGSSHAVDVTYDAGRGVVVVRQPGVGAGAGAWSVALL